MQTLTILNSREVKELRRQLESQFGYFFPGDYAYLQNEKQRLFVISRDLARVDWKKLIVDKVGLYLGEDLGEEFRLSKEGAQLLGAEAKENKIPLKNIVELTPEEVKHYFTGAELKKDCGKASRLILLKYKEDIFGCARYKEGKVLNFLPKIHRGEVIP